MTLQRITRHRRLTPEEGAKCREVREQVAQELPELIARHDERTLAEAFEELRRICEEEDYTLESPPPQER